MKIKHYISNSFHCFRTMLNKIILETNNHLCFQMDCFQTPLYVFNDQFMFRISNYVSNICFQYKWNLLIGRNILKHEKPWLDLLLVLVMFGGFHTCVTKMVVVPFLFLIYWCAFLVEFQELNFKTKMPKLDPGVKSGQIALGLIAF